MRTTPRKSALLTVLFLALAACASAPFDVENRDTPIHVWVTAPELARGAGGTVDLLIHVAGQKVLEGPVRIPPGTPTIQLPTVYARSGPTTISAILRGGRGVTQQRVKIDGESWVQIIVNGSQLRVIATDNQPQPWG